MRTTISAAAGVGAALLGTASLAFDYKGVTIGGPATPEQIAEKLGVKCGAGAVGQVCNGYATVGGASAHMNLVIAPSGLVQRISLSFDSYRFDDVEAAVLQKFGKPASTQDEAVSNRMGATFQNRTHTWRDSLGNRVMLTRYAGTLDKALLYYSSPEDDALYERLQKEKSNDL